MQLVPLRQGRGGATEAASAVGRRREPCRSLPTAAAAAASRGLASDEEEEAAELFVSGRVAIHGGGGAGELLLTHGDYLLGLSYLGID
jgi:hypothetical protein